MYSCSNPTVLRNCTIASLILICIIPYVCVHLLLGLLHGVIIAAFFCQVMLIYDQSVLFEQSYTHVHVSKIVHFKLPDTSQLLLVCYYKM